jgi:hypothetical protein
MLIAAGGWFAEADGCVMQKLRRELENQMNGRPALLVAGSPIVAAICRYPRDDRSYSAEGGQANGSLLQPHPLW